MSTVVRHWLADELASGMDAADVVTDPAVLDAYACDAAPFSPAGRPTALVFPRGIADVQHVMRTAFRLGVAVVPQGTRTGLTGAANAVDGCVLLSMTKMDRILDVDPVNRLARCQPGVTNRSLREAVARHGLSSPSDPLSPETSTIGGDIATGAAGGCCATYGTTADHVLGLSLVLSDGRLTRLGRRTASRAAGYDLARLFVGSEGTLGVTVEATLSLRPKADPSLALLAQFDSDAAAADAVAAVIGAGHTPSALEVLDAVTTAAVADLGHPDLGLRDATTLLIESDTPDRAQDIDAMARLCDSAGARHVTPGRTVEAARRLRKARAMVPSALRAAAARDCAHPTVFIADVAVPRTRLADLVEAVAAIAEAHAILIATVGHAADGRLHPTVVFDQDDLDAHERARHAHDEVMAAALSMNGTITGEHGVGLLKRDWLGRELDPVAMELHREIKNLLDPTGILNPGKVL